MATSLGKKSLGKKSLGKKSLGKKSLGCLVLVVSLLPTALQAQHAPELHFERLSVEDDLSHNTVWSVYQGALGFIWVGTAEGLNRYDGHDFKVYRHDPENPGSLADNEVFQVYEDRQGELWIGTSGGLDRFDRAQERFVHHRHDPDDDTSLSHDSVWKIFEDGTGSLWIGTVGGLNQFDRSTAQFTRFIDSPDDPTSLSGHRIDDLCEDRDGGLWIATEKALNRFDRRTQGFTHYRHDPDDPGSLSTNETTEVHEGPDGRLWVGTLAGLNRFDRRTRTFERYHHDPDDPRSLSQDRISFLYLDSLGEFWIGTESGGLDLLDRTSSSVAFIHYRYDSTDPTSLSSDGITPIYEDRTGVLWVGTYAGLSKVERAREPFRTFRQQPGRPGTLNGKVVSSILEDRSGALWVGTLDSGLNRIDRERQTLDHYMPVATDPSSLPHRSVNDLYEDRSGTLWVGTDDGLSRLTSRVRGRERFQRFKHDPGDAHSLGNNGIVDIHEDLSGRLWVATYSGLNRFDPARQDFVRYPADQGHPQGLGYHWFTSLLEDSSGTLWFGTYSSGLYALTGDRFEHFFHDPNDADSLNSNKVTDLLEDSEGYLWIGTSAGLNRLDPVRRRFLSFRQKDGLASDGVSAMLEDAGGNLWISTTHGLSRLDTRRRSFRSYDVEDGLQGNRFTPGASYRSPDGELFFGGLNGFNAFYPDRIVSDTSMPAVAVTDFRLFNESVLVRPADPDSPLEQSILYTRRLVLSHNDYVFSLEFAALHHASPRSHRYAYRLEGFDRDWIFTDSTKRFAQYSNLNPGDYTFRVQASNGDGVWNQDGAVLEIVVLPPPWQTWWAYTLYGLTALLTVVGSIRQHRKKVDHEHRIVVERERLIEDLEARNEELERFNYTVSHDLRNPLVTIRNFVGLVRCSVANGKTEKLTEDLERIDTAAKRMQRLLEEVLELSRVGRVISEPEEVAFASIAEEAAALVAGAIIERGVEIRITPDLPVVYGDRMRLVEVVQNLMENAVKFMGGQKAPRIVVGARFKECDADGSRPVLYVQDNGIGIEARYQEKVFGLFERLDQGIEGTGVGLALVKRIVEFHGGHIWVESAGPGRGSTFCFTLPNSE